MQKKISIISTRNFLEKPLNFVLFFFCLLLANGFMVFILLTFFNTNLDPDYYNILARNLMDGKGFIIDEAGEPVFWRMPVYPLLLVAVYSVFGVSHLAMTFTQIILNSLTSLLIYKIADRVFSPPVGVLSAIAYAFYPLSAFYLVKAMPIIQFNLLFFMFIYAGYRFYDTPSLRWAFFLGVLQGLLTLCQVFFKGFPMFFALSFFLLLFIRYWQGREKIMIKKISSYLLFGVMMFFGFSLVLMPWCMRNYKLLDTFPVIGVGGGFTLWMGNNIYFDGLDYDQLSDEKKEEMDREQMKIIGSGSVSDFENDKKLFDAAVENIIRYPYETFVLLIKKMYRLWFSVYTVEMQKYQWIVTSLQLLLLIPGTLGLLLATRNRLPTQLFFILIAYFFIAYTLFTATVRYVIPLMPIFICCTMYLLVEIRKGKLLKKQ